jgi:pentatricopeptide repeat protein
VTISYCLHHFVFLQNLSVPPDLTSYNILLKTCCNAREFNLAQEIYEEMKKKERNGLLKLDVFTYSTMIKVWGLLLLLSMHYGFLWFPELFSL